jgi:hypothetical protein
MVSPVHGDYRRCQAEIPLIVLCRFPGSALRNNAAINVTTHEGSGAEYELRTITSGATGNLDAGRDNFLFINKTVGSPTTIYLPDGSTVEHGKQFTVIDGKGDAATNNIVIASLVGNTINNASTYIISSNYGSATFKWDGNEYVATEALKPNISASFPLIYASTTGVLSFSGLATTGPWTIGNLAYVSDSRHVTGVSTSTLSASSPLTGSFIQIGSSGTLGIQAANASQNGYLTVGDYQLLHAPTSTFSSPLVYTGSTNAVTCPTCTVNGLTSYDAFTHGSTFATTTSATNTPIWTQGVFFSSSTVAASQFPYASTTAFTSGNIFATNVLSISSSSPAYLFSVGSGVNSFAVNASGYVGAGVPPGGNSNYSFDAANGFRAGATKLNAFDHILSSSLGHIDLDQGASIGTGIGVDVSPPSNGLYVKGNTGIGTTSPGSAALAVQGDVFTAGSFTSTSTYASTFPYASSTYHSMNNELVPVVCTKIPRR